MGGCPGWKGSKEELRHSRWDCTKEAKDSAMTIIRDREKLSKKRYAGVALKVSVDHLPAACMSAGDVPASARAVAPQLASIDQRQKLEKRYVGDG